eukprot:g44319.t1
MIYNESTILPWEEQITYPVEKLLKVASTEREFGNYFFQLRRYEDAKDQYKKALSVFAHCPETDKEQMQEIHSSKLLLYLNLSLVSLKLNAPRRALVYGERALSIESKNPKALFRCGQISNNHQGNQENIERMFLPSSGVRFCCDSPADYHVASVIFLQLLPLACILLLEYDKAKDFLLRAQKLEPFNPDVNCALVKLD